MITVITIRVSVRLSLLKVGIWRRRLCRSCSFLLSRGACIDDAKLIVLMLKHVPRTAEARHGSTDVYNRTINR